MTALLRPGPGSGPGAISGSQTAILTARSGCARSGASRSGFTPRFTRNSSGTLPGPFYGYYRPDPLSGTASTLLVY